MCCIFKTVYWIPTVWRALLQVLGYSHEQDRVSASWNLHSSGEIWNINKYITLYQTVISGISKCWNVRLQALKTSAVRVRNMLYEESLNLVTWNQLPIRVHLSGKVPALDTVQSTSENGQCTHSSPEKHIRKEKPGTRVYRVYWWSVPSPTNKYQSKALRSPWWSNWPLWPDLWLHPSHILHPQKPFCFSFPTRVYYFTPSSLCR